MRFRSLYGRNGPPPPPPPPPRRFRSARDPFHPSPTVLLRLRLSLNSFTARSDGSRFFDWTRPAALHAVTQGLLHRDFGLRWDCPPDRLCPPLPNRLNYILWLQDLLASWLPLAASAEVGEGSLGFTESGALSPAAAAVAHPAPSASVDSEPLVAHHRQRWIPTGIDIGTGASAIYCLLGACQ